MLPSFKYILSICFLKNLTKKKFACLSPNALICYLLYLCFLLYLYCKEIFLAGEAKYFLSCLLWSSLFIVAILIPKSKNILSSLVSLMCVAFLSCITYTNLFFGNFLFYVSPDNAGFVSIHEREQLSALSLAIFFIFSCLLFPKEKNRNLIFYHIILVFSFPCFFLFGSFTAFYIALAGYLVFLIGNKTKYILVFLIGSGLAVFNSVITSDLYFETFKIHEQSETQVQASRLFLPAEVHIEKIFLENSRLSLLSKSFESLSEYPFGTSWNDWQKKSPMGSPHSLFGEIIAYGGIVGILFIISFIFLNLKKFFLVPLNYKILLFFLFCLSFLNSNNLQFPFFASFLVLLNSKLSQ